MAKWRFPSNDHGENKGINDSGISTFRGAPLSALAREICQNSLDAAINTENERVLVDFNMFSMPTNCIPGKDDLEDAFQRCLVFWDSQKSRVTNDYFDTALKTIRADDCVCLRISDFNTTGLTGSREKINSDWTNLTKSSGASDKKGTAGGSYGIGKYAPFACSDLFTVFYSTYDYCGERASQGVSRLVTFSREDGEDTQGIGYYGNEHNTPLFEEASFDPSFHRNDGEFGTDIYIIGYKYSGADWKKELLVSVLDGFLGALWRNQLVVRIGDLLIEKDTLNQLMNEYGSSIKKYTAYYYKVLTSANTVWFKGDFNKMGEVELGLCLFEEPDAPKRVAMIRRTGMKIMDKGSLPGAVPFAGVMFINGEKINQQLRAIENPEHTKWEPDRSPKPVIARATVKALIDYLKSRIEELINSEASETIDAIGVGAFLPDVDEGNNNEVEETLSDKVVEVEIKPVKAKIKRKKEADDGSHEAEITDDILRDPGGDDNAWFHDDGKTKQKGDRPSQDAHAGTEEKSKGTIKKMIRSEKVVCLCQNREKGNYILKVVPKTNTRKGEIELFLSAETQNYPAPIKHVSIKGQTVDYLGNVINGLEFEDGEELVLNVELDYTDYCSMEVQLYAIEE